MTANISSDATIKNAALLPVLVSYTDDSIDVVIQGQRFTLANSATFDELTRLQLASSDNVLKISSTSNHILQGTMLQLGEKIVLSLPKELLTAAKLTDSELSQLQTLAKREQGYPLPVATISGNKLSFPASNTINLPANVQLNDGNYTAKISLTNNILSLQLQPIKSEIFVQLTPAAPAPMPTSQTPTAIPDADAMPQIVVAKNDLAQVASSWMHRLERQSWTNTANVEPSASTTSKLTPDAIAEIKAAAPSPTTTADKGQMQAPKNTPNPTQLQDNLAAANSNVSKKGNDAQIKPDNGLVPQISANKPTKASIKAAPTEILTPAKAGQTAAEQNVASSELTSQLKKAEFGSNNVLTKALYRMGLTPQTDAVALPKHNLAAALMKALPELTPRLLTELVEPEKLQQELLASLNFQASRVFTTLPPSQSDSIAFMFQLLLGARMNNPTASAPITQRLKQYLESLQASSGLSGKLLEALERSRGLESISHLVSSIRLFQQSSQELAGQGFYFALPYQLDNHTEQFEGKFEYDEANTGEQAARGWRLQLKFALTNGAMLVNAFVQGKSLRLELTSSSESLLQRITTFESLLNDKLSQVGFNVDNIQMRMGNVPASVLPGDHVLVKVKV
ncbi:hypothetical protein HR45_13815 [Shewanella mangrovi]|uniref:Uncharacterized protein n=2 Tax=Shewanella mangrovi TaxID=1515746 RepID=A0A094JFU1_9GAMM|nr:hypothetical protein HR45_13815 [Shewanella mangrovi]